MKIIKFKREDVLELNEENVISLYRDCLATPDTPENRVHKTKFIDSEKIPEIELDQNKIIESYSKIQFLLGQLYYTHLINRERISRPLSMSQGFINYKSEPWTQNQTFLFALYYLSHACASLEKFDSHGNAYPIDDLIGGWTPTLSPNDPAFAEWAKDHIED